MDTDEFRSGWGSWVCHVTPMNYSGLDGDHGCASAGCQKNTFALPFSTKVYNQAPLVSNNFHTSTGLWRAPPFLVWNPERHLHLAGDKGSHPFNIETYSWHQRWFKSCLTVSVGCVRVWKCTDSMQEFLTSCPDRRFWIVRFRLCQRSVQPETSTP